MPRAAFQVFFLSKHVMRVALSLAHCPHIWLPQLLSHWSGSQTVPVTLVLRLLASAELQLYQTSLPPPDHLENNLIWVDSTRMIPLSYCRMSYERLLGSHNFPIIAIMEFDWYCSWGYTWGHMGCWGTYHPPKGHEWACWKEIEMSSTTTDASCTSKTGLQCQFRNYKDI